MLPRSNRDLEFKDCQDRTDQEGKDCEKQLDDLMISKEAIEVDSVGVNVSQHTKNTFEAELHDAIDMGTNKSTAEIKLDKDSKTPTVKSPDSDSYQKVQEFVNQEENKRRKSRH